MSKSFADWWREGQPRRYPLTCAEAAWNWQQVSIDDLREQVEKLTKERDELDNALLDQERIWANSVQNVERKLAALAEQNEKLKECLSHYAVYQTSYGTKNAAAKLLEELK